MTHDSEVCPLLKMDSYLISTPRRQGKNDMPLFTHSLFSININTGILRSPSKADQKTAQYCEALALFCPIPTVSYMDSCHYMNLIPCHFWPLSVKLNEKHNSRHVMGQLTQLQPASFKAKVCRTHEIPFTAHWRCINNPRDRKEQK